MPKHAQLTINQLRGPMNQLLTILQGEKGQEWLKAFNSFLRKEPVWVEKIDEEYWKEWEQIDVTDKFPLVPWKDDVFVELTGRLVKKQGGDSEPEQDLRIWICISDTVDPSQPDLLIEFDRDFRCDYLLKLKLPKFMETFGDDMGWGVEGAFVSAALKCIASGGITFDYEPMNSGKVKISFELGEKAEDEDYIIATATVDDKWGFLKPGSLITSI